MWTTPFVKNWKNTEKYVLKNSMKYQKMKLSMQGHWPTCEPHHLSTGTRQYWLTSHNYSPLWWVFIIIYILYHHYWLGSNIIHILLDLFHTSVIITDLFPIICHLVDWNFLYHTFVIANLRHQNEADLLPITAYNSGDLVKVIPHVPKRLPLG